MRFADARFGELIWGSNSATLELGSSSHPEYKNPILTLVTRVLEEDEKAIEALAMQLSHDGTGYFFIEFPTVDFEIDANSDISATSQKINIHPVIAGGTQINPVYRASKGAFEEKYPDNLRIIHHVQEAAEFYLEKEHLKKLCKYSAITALFRKAKELGIAIKREYIFKRSYDYRESFNLEHDYDIIKGTETANTFVNATLKVLNCLKENKNYSQKQRALRILIGYSWASRTGHSLHEYQVLFEHFIEKINKSEYFNPNKPDTFLAEVWRIFRFEFGIEYGLNKDSSLISSLDTNCWDCDNSATLIFDVAKRFGLEPQMVVTSNHALLKIVSCYFETTSGTVLSSAKFKENYNSGFEEKSDILSCALLGLEGSTTRKTQKEIKWGYRLAAALIGDSRSWCKLAADFISKGDFDKALEILCTQDRSHSPNILTSFLLARVLLAQGRIEEAQTKIESAFKLWGFGHKYIGQLWTEALFLQGKFKEVEQILNFDLINPESAPLAYKFKGLIAFAQAEYQNSFKYLRKSRWLGDTSSIAVELQSGLLAGVSTEKLNDTVLAGGRKSHVSPGFYVERAFFNMENGRNDFAISDLENISPLYPSLIVLSGLALAQLRDNLHEDYRATLQKIFEKWPDSRGHLYFENIRTKGLRMSVQAQLSRISLSSDLKLQQVRSFETGDFVAAVSSPIKSPLSAISSLSLGLSFAYHDIFTKPECGGYEDLVKATQVLYAKSIFGGEVERSAGPKTAQLVRYYNFNFLPSVEVEVLNSCNAKKIIAGQDNFVSLYSLMSLISQSFNLADSTTEDMEKVIAVDPGYERAHEILTSALPHYQYLNRAERLSRIEASLAAFPDNQVILAKARMLYSSFALAEAENLLVSLDALPQNAEALALMGEINHDKNNLETALRYYDASLALKGDNYNIAIRRVRLLLTLNRDSKEILKEIVTLESIGGATIQTRKLAGVVHMTKSDLTLAAEAFGAALTLANESSFLSFCSEIDSLDRVFDKHVKYHETLEVLIKIAEGQTNKSQIFSSIARLANLRGQYEEGLKYAQEALLYNPIDNRSRYLRITLLRMTNQNEQFVQAVNESEGLSPEHILAERAYFFQRNIGDKESALRYFEESIACKCVDSNVFANTASCLMDLKSTDHSKILKYLNKSIELNSKNSFGYSLRGKFYLEKQGQFQLALGDFLIAYQYDPTNPWICNLIATCLLKLDRPAEADFYCIKSFTLSYTKDGKTSSSLSTEDAKIPGCYSFYGGILFNEAAISIDKAEEISQGVKRVFSMPIDHFYGANQNEKPHWHMITLEDWGMLGSLWLRREEASLVLVVEVRLTSCTCPFKTKIKETLKVILEDLFLSFEGLSIRVIDQFEGLVDRFEDYSIKPAELKALLSSSDVQSAHTDYTDLRREAYILRAAEHMGESEFYNQNAKSAVDLAVDAFCSEFEWSPLWIPESSIAKMLPLFEVEERTPLLDSYILPAVRVVQKFYEKRKAGDFIGLSSQIEEERDQAQRVAFVWAKEEFRKLRPKDWYMKD